MPQYDNELRGVLFKNAKRTSDSHPNAKGECQINGVRYWVSAWTSEKRDSGEKYQRLQFERAKPEHQPNTAQAQASPAAPDPSLSAPTETDDIPF